MALGRIPGLRQLPPRLQRADHRLVLFESWHGAYSDNPRAISEALHERDPSWRHVWVDGGDGGAVPQWADTVRPGSRRYLEVLGRARHVVANINMPAYFRKRRHTTYLQTWHGTPLKRIAFDIARPRFAGSHRYLAALRRDVAKWDFLLSPNRFSTDVFRQAFGYQGRILETGYPRNDILRSPRAETTRAAVRERLGVPSGARAVLYAPTWRDTSQFPAALDLDRLAARLPDHVFLVRAHHLVAPPAVGHNGSQLDVTGYPDIRDLYLAADVLVTDYSSAMFDFAVTGKPQLFFTYDLAEYRDEVRGFYFDFAREAPGPLLETTDALGEALADLDAVARRHAGAYAHFRRRFCALEDGHASERVVDAVFAG